MRTLVILAAALVALPARAQYDEIVTVSRILVDVRVTMANGEAVADLTPADFNVTLDGRAVTVASARWVDEQKDAGYVAAPAPAGASSEWIAPLVPVPGRLFVFFVQTDFTRDYTRTRGQMKFRRYAEEIIEGFAPEDRIAVLSFDSHLKFRRDFTTDKESVIEAIRESIRIDDPARPQPADEAALGPRLTRAALRRATTSEKALRLIGEALEPIPGPKTLVLIGWGLGHRVRGGTAVAMDREWPEAHRALDAARVSIFALDITEADSHDLSWGMKNAAELTGGFYASTYNFPRAAVDRLRRTLSGYYMLELRRPADLPGGSYTVDISVKRRGSMRVMFPQVVAISAPAR